MTGAAAAILGCMVMYAAAARGQSHATVRFMTLDPGHFHAALVQKFMYPDVDPRVHVYAPSGPELADHLKRIEGFNTRLDRPTKWQQIVYTGPDFLEKMLAEKPGNVVVIAGNNARKTEYILRAVQAGLHVLADKPMAITPADLVLLREAFATAARNRVLLADIMTERFEITSILQRRLAHQPAVFGTLEPGTPAAPAITKVSVHHFFKTVAGATLVRPPWFFDVTQQGEGMVDVATHLVDLVQWTAFPDEPLDPADVSVLAARRWATPMTREQFARVTGGADVPPFLQKDLRDGAIHVFSNGEFTYRLRGVHARISVSWDFEAPPGGSDTHYSEMRGTKARLVIRQGAEQQYKPVLFVERAGTGDAGELEAPLRQAVGGLQADHPGVDLRRDGTAWIVIVPDRYHVGHEAHFAQVTQAFLAALREGRLADWEVPAMITKYATMLEAYDKGRGGPAEGRN